MNYLIGVICWYVVLGVAAAPILIAGTFPAWGEKPDIKFILVMQLIILFAAAGLAK